MDFNWTPELIGAKQVRDPPLLSSFLFSISFSSASFSLSSYLFLSPLILFIIDWNMWCAAVASEETRDMIVNTTLAYIHSGDSQGPLPDRYNTTTGLLLFSSPPPPPLLLLLLLSSSSSPLFSSLLTNSMIGVAVGGIRARPTVGAHFSLLLHKKR